MNYKERYRRRINNINGGSATQSIYNKNKAYYNRHFKEDASYREASIILAPNMEEELIDVRLANVDNDTNEKIILFRPDTEVHVGDYIKISNKEYYLIKEFQRDQISPFAKVIKCRKILKWKNLPSNILIPCVLETNSYGSKGELFNVDQQSDYDSRGIIRVQKNRYTETIYNGMRFIFGGTKREVYEIALNQSIFTTDDFDEGKGYLELVTKYTKAIKGDDFINSIAYNEDLDIMTEIENDIYDNIQLIDNEGYLTTKEEKRFRLNKKVEDVVFSLDDDTVATITSSNERECYIKGLIPNKIVTLSVSKDGEILLQQKLYISR